MNVWQNFQKLTDRIPSESVHTYNPIFWSPKIRPSIDNIKGKLAIFRFWSNKGAVIYATGYEKEESSTLLYSWLIFLKKIIRISNASEMFIFSDVPNRSGLVLNRQKIVVSRRLATEGWCYHMQNLDTRRHISNFDPNLQTYIINASQYEDHGPRHHR